MDRPLLFVAVWLALLFVDGSTPHAGSATVYTIAVSGGT